MKKNLLLIAYYFPPDGGGGTQRPAKFCRYLPQFGWRTTVVTRTIQSATQRGKWDPHDETLLHDVENVARIVRVGAVPTELDKEWPAWVLREDPVARWMTPVYHFAKREIQRGEFDAMLITMSPFWLNHLGRRLQHETGIPVVFDLRDPWALDGWQPSRTRWHWRREIDMMRQTLQSAAGVVANTPDAGRRMLKWFPGLAPEKLEVITNGYDAADFEHASTDGVDRAGRDDEFVLVHTGTLHGHVLYAKNRIKELIKRVVNYSPERIVPSGRTVLHLLAAQMRKLRESRSSVAHRVRIVLVGDIDQGTRRCINESGVADAVTCTGYVTHTESIRWLLRGDGLFLPLHESPRGERSLIVAGKEYEYLAAGKPILSCLPPGDARDFAEETGMSYFAKPTDENQIASALERMVADWADGKFRHASAAASISRFERRELTRRLAGFLDRIVGADTSTAPSDEIIEQAKLTA